MEHRIASLVLPWLLAGSLMACVPGEQQTLRSETWSQPRSAPGRDVCAECVGPLMAAFDEVIGSPDPTLEDMTRFVHGEDEWILAFELLPEDEYYAHVNSDWSVTRSLYGLRIQEATGEADLTQYQARMDGPVCIVELANTEVVLTISNRPRCFVTEILHRGTNLLGESRSRDDRRRDN